MKRDYFIYDADGERKLDDLEFPIRVGGRKFAGIVIPGVSHERLIATIALDDGHAFIQPANSDSDIFHNAEKLTESAWLKSGDRIQVAESILAWDVEGDRVHISVVPRSERVVQFPAATQAHAEPVNDNLPVSEAGHVMNGGKKLRRSVIAFVSLLALIAGYLMMATSLHVEVEPETALVKVNGFPPAISVRGSYLVFPGNYQLDIRAEGYQPAVNQVDISMGPAVRLSYSLAELPGVVTINTDQPAILTVFVDEVETPPNEQGDYELTRGNHVLRVESIRFLPQQVDIKISGFGAGQSVDMVLEPAWALGSIASSPAGAEVLIDGQSVGFTPLQTEILRGRREIRLQKPGFKPLTSFRTVEAGEDFNLGEKQLEPVDGHLSLSSTPGGASILISGKFHGVTPQVLHLPAETDYQLQLSKSGYVTTDHSFRLAAEEERTMDIALPVEYGTVFLNVAPAGANLTINGKRSENSSGRLRLQTLKNTLRFSKDGYVSKEITVTPKPAISQSLEVSLVTQKQQQAAIKKARTPDLLTTGIGQTMELVKPKGSFLMGASRRDAGRRANESRRLVELKRPFYLAHREVTNAEFRRYKASHDSGSVDSAPLDGEKQPVVNVSWDDAARFCNWLSKRDGLPLAYREEGGRMQAVNPMTTGYRLPTEAEWAWVARRFNSETEQRYPWTGGFPPTTVSGNYADSRIADTLADVVPAYDDGFRGTAPVGSFAVWPAVTTGAIQRGFYDLGGNAAEWMHDNYAIYPGEATRLVTDPMGPATGQHHVVRGSSWRNGSISELRLSYRDYSNKQRHDLGFRIARYAE